MDAPDGGIIVVAVMFVILIVFASIAGVDLSGESTDTSVPDATATVEVRATLTACQLAPSGMSFKNTTMVAINNCEDNHVVITDTASGDSVTHNGFFAKTFCGTKDILLEKVEDGTEWLAILLEKPVPFDRIERGCY